MKYLSLLVLLVACPAPDDGNDPDHHLTDNELWMFDVNTDWSTGWQDIEITIFDQDDAPQSGLTFEAEVTMPAMGHGSDEDTTASELGDGVYGVNVHFQMEGAWELSGTISDDQDSDTFVVDLDVLAE